MSRVAIIMGSGKDRPTMQKAADTLDRFGVGWDMRVLSAHKTPEEALAFAEAAADTYSVVIAGAGKAAALRTHTCPLTHLTQEHTLSRTCRA